jgi:RNA polymerase sigma factor (sigma-70 family)
MNFLLDSNDPLVFNKFYKENNRKLILYAKSIIGNAEEAKDIVGETFNKMWAEKKQFINGLQQEVYIYTVVKNACIDYLRKEKLKRRVEYTFIQTAITTEYVIVTKYQEPEMVKLLYFYINCLPDRMKQVIKLTHLDGFSRIEVAKMLELSPHTIRNTNVAAINTLRSSFGLV